MTPLKWGSWSLISDLLLIPGVHWLRWTSFHWKENEEIEHEEQEFGDLLWYEGRRRKYLQFDLWSFSGHWTSWEITLLRIHSYWCGMESQRWGLEISLFWYSSFTLRSSPYRALMRKHEESDHFSIYRISRDYHHYRISMRQMHLLQHTFSWKHHWRGKG